MKPVLQNFFYELRTRGNDLKLAMQDVSDVCADASLSSSPAVINLLRKIQYAMDRAASEMTHTEMEQDEIENSCVDHTGTIRMRDEEIGRLKLQVETLMAQVPTQEGLTAMEMELANQPTGMIEAIKQFRRRTGLGLKESKDAIEQYRDRHGIKRLM